MITKNDITRIAKHILKRQRGLRDHQIIHPVREWFIGLVCSLLILVGGAVWSAFTYFEVSGRTVETTSTDVVTANVYRGDIVNAALAKFRERTDNFNQLLENRVEITPRELGESMPQAESATSETEPTSSESESGTEISPSTTSDLPAESESVPDEVEGEVLLEEANVPPEPTTDSAPIDSN